MNDSILERLDTLTAIVAASKIPVEHDLWDRATIAAYLKCSISQVARFIAVPAFPEPTRLPTPEGGQAQPRWLAREVIAWAESYKKAA